MDNVLEIDDASAYKCRVVGYLVKRSLLVVKVKSADTQYYVIFPDVHHFYGSFLWQGARLRVATRDEQFEFTLQNTVVDADGMLLIFEGVDATVHILGGEWIGIFPELPERFQY